MNEHRVKRTESSLSRLIEKVIYSVLVNLLCFILVLSEYIHILTNNYHTSMTCWLDTVASSCTISKDVHICVYTLLNNCFYLPISETVMNAT